MRLFNQELRRQTIILNHRIMARDTSGLVGYV